jgi:hypothetical protein
MRQFNEALVEATRRVITGVCSFFPSFLAFVFTAIAFSIAGIALGALVGRVLRAIDLDGRLRRRGTSWIAIWARDSSPALWVQRGIAWSGITLGWLLGLVALGAGMKSPLVLNLVAYIPRLVTASVILVLGHLLARFLARGVLISAVNKQICSASLLAAGTRWLIMIFVVAMVFEHLRVGSEIVRLAFALLLGGLALTAAIAVGLGAKNMVCCSLEKLAQDEHAFGAKAPQGASQQRKEVSQASGTGSL